MLFLQKFTTEERERFEAIREAAKAEIEVKLRPEITEEVRRLESAIDAAKAKRDSKIRLELQSELRQYKSEIQAAIVHESRQLAKARFSYQIFMYEAEKVGITATGDEDQNELYPNDKKPDGVDLTCLEWYRNYVRDPNSIVTAELPL